MTNHGTALKALTDRDLLETVTTLAARERGATADLIAALAEMDARRLYLGEGCSSLFTYCTQVLHLSEHAAYGRIEAARAARRFPMVLDLLAKGSINLTTVTLLASHLTDENCRQLLADASHTSRREVERMVAAIRPQPSVPATIRKVPVKSPSLTERRLDIQEAPSPDASHAAPATVRSERPAIVAPLAPERYKIQFTVSREVYDRLRAAQDLLRHVIPHGDVAAIFEKALSLLLEDVARRKCAATTRPRASAATRHGLRHVPAAVRREVWARDGGRCAFLGARGRCTERGLLEFHHVTPFAAGGGAVAGNIELRCRRHNAYEAALFFGDGDLSEEKEPITGFEPSLLGSDQ